MASSANATDIYQLYQDAVKYDPIIQAASATLRSEQEAENAALGQLLPQIGAQYQYQMQDQDTNRDDIFLASTLDQDTETLSAAVTQNILNLNAWYSFRSAQQLSEKAVFDFRQNEQQLISRTLDAYLSVLRAYNNLSSSIAEEAAFQQQLDQTRQRFNVGLVAITDVNESQAAADLAKVSRLSNQGLLEAAYENLTLLTGKIYPYVVIFGDNLPIIDPTPMDRQSWVDLSLKGNLNLISSEYALNAAKFNYKQAASNHLPTITGSYTYSNREILAGELQQGSNIVDENDWVGALPDFESSTVAINLQLPIFTGGTTSANRRSALAQFHAAEAQLNGAQRAVIQQSRADHINVQTQIQTVAARKQAITSTQSALDAIEAGYQVGTRNIVD
ncbi:MAG: TolC family outer membrane protein, partial [Pseudomonadales bacterium]|nr:TolC family outer membrane protein [Pseudomonadales bacterium]